MSSDTDRSRQYEASGNRFLPANTFGVICRLVHGPGFPQ